MRRLSFIVLPRRARIAAMAALAVAAPSLVLASGARAAPEEGIHKIQHVVMIMQENRSFDSYFGTYPGANGIPAGVCVPDPKNGGCERPFHDPSDTNFGGPHGSESASSDIDGGKMDGFVGVAEHWKRKARRALLIVQPARHATPAAPKRAARVSM